MRTRLPLAILLLPAAALVAGCSFHAARPDGSGTIESTQVRLAPEVGGRLLAVDFEEGARLHKGQILARLDATPYQLRVQEARAALAQAEAHLALLRAGSRAEDIQRAREQAREARAAAVAAADDLARIAKLAAMGTATPKQRDDATAARDGTAAALAASEQQLARWVNGSRPEEIREAEAAADVARARLAQAEKNAADCTVAAPMDGVISVKSAEAGDVVPAGGTLGTLSRLDEVWLAVFVPERELAALRVGQQAWVKPDGIDRPVTGTVTFVATDAEFAPKNVQTADERAKLVFRVKITLANPDGLFKPGMPADAWLHREP